MKIMLDHIQTHLLILTCILLNVSTHEMKMGSCPKVDVVPDFDYNKMIGLWYVIQKTKSASTCVTLDFRSNNNKLTVAETCLPMGISVPFVLEKFTQIGKLKVPDQNNAAKMRLAYPFSIIPYSEVDFWVIDTDYTTYAATWSCRPIAFTNRQQGMILSRNEVLDDEIVHRLRNKFVSYKINKNAFSIVKQKGCVRNEVLNPKDLDPENNNPQNETNQDTITVTTTHSETMIQTSTHSTTHTITAAPKTHTTIHTVVVTPDITTVIVTPETTGIVTPETTGIVTPGTTGIVTPETTGIVTPETTGIVTPGTTGIVTSETTITTTPETTITVTPETTLTTSPGITTETITQEVPSDTANIQPTTTVTHAVEPTVTRLPDDPHDSRTGINEISDV